MKLILYMVMSMDGIVAIDEKRDISSYSSKEDHDFFIKGASACDAAIMGRFSYNKALPCGKKYLLSHSTELDLESGTVRLSGNAQSIIERIKEDGNERVALLGGPRTNHAFLSGGFVDDIFLTIEPIILGKGIHFSIPDDNVTNWSLSHSIRLNKKGTVVNHYVRELSTELKERYNNILHNGLFCDTIHKLNLAEKERFFCKHDITHLLDTARIMQLINLEEGLCLDKDIVYATALLHDIGRLAQYEDGTPHEKAGAILAEKILSECGYDADERTLIISAISRHRQSQSKGKSESELLSDILYRADKAGRLCFQCDARLKCNWPESKKNAMLIF